MNEEQIKQHIRNLEGTSYNEGSHDLACRCADSLTIITQLQQRIAELEAERDTSAEKALLIDVCYIEGTDPFIYGVNGEINMGGLDELEQAIIEYQQDEDETVHPCRSAGEYVFKAHFEPPEFDDYGRVYSDGYWDLTLVKFTTDKDTNHG